VTPDPAGISADSPGISDAPDVHRLRVLTVNTHKGFTALNRRFILPELREAVRATSADLVFLQEVLGGHDGHATRYQDWPSMSQYEFLADSMWSDFAYGQNAVYPDGHHGNALLPSTRSFVIATWTFPSPVPNAAGCCTASCRSPDTKKCMPSACI
jgi:endonuclease/exonuclease/phosphatase family metal-dependent hydrolase